MAPRVSPRVGLGVFLVMIGLAGCSSPAPPLETAPSGVVLWPQYGDFLLEGNKAVLPSTALRLEGKDEAADYLLRIAQTPQARWIGDFMDDTRAENLATNIYRSAESQETRALIAFAGDPGAECQITPETEDALADAYVSRAHAVADPLANYEAEVWVVFEPFGLASLGDCDGQGDRIGMMTDALEIFGEAGMTIYVDVGGVGQLEPEEAARRLRLLPVEHVSGIALNVSDYRSNEDQAAYGEAVIAALEFEGVRDMGYVIDTSRNGEPFDDADLCNPPGAAIGKAPRLVREGNLDAYLWVKRPGESDGSCHGGVGLGQFGIAQALDLARLGDPENA